MFPHEGRVVSDEPLGSHGPTAEDESFGAAFCSYIITIMPKDESQECAADDKWETSVCV